MTHPNVTPPNYIQQGPGGFHVSPNITGINQQQASQSVVTQSVAPEASVIQRPAPVYNRPDPAQPGPEQSVQGPPMQQVGPNYYANPVMPAQPEAPPAPAPQAPPEKAQGIVQMPESAPAAFSIGSTPVVSPAGEESTEAELKRLREEVAAFQAKRTNEVNNIVKTATRDAAGKALLDKWVDANLSSYEKQAINSILASGSISEVQDTMNSLVTRYIDAQKVPAGDVITTPGKPQTNTPRYEISGGIAQAFNPTSTPAVAPASTYMSAQAYEAAMMTPEYNRNPAYKQQVDAARLASIKVDMSQRGPNRR